MVGTRVLMLQLDHADPPGRLQDWLQAAGLEVDVLDVAGGAAVPADLSGGPSTDGGWAGLVVLGGTMSSSDDVGHPFLRDVRALLRAVVRDETPTLAICLGAQLLATANGGRVVVNPEGPEIGVQLIAKRSSAGTDPLLATLPITPDVIQWHWDTVAVLPPGAIQLASSPRCENQIFRLGRLAWGVQFHLETTPDVVAGWAHGDAGKLYALEPDLDLDLIVSRAAAAHDDIEQTWTPFVQAFAAAVRDPASVPAARGVPTSTAAPLTDPAAIRAALAAEASAARMPPGGPAMLPMPGRRPGD